MKDNDNLWFKIGFALERARRGGEAVAAPSALAGFRDRLALMADEVRTAPAKGKRPSLKRKSDPRDLSTEALVLAGLTSLGVTLLRRWRARYRVGLLDLVRGGTAGAAAALAVEMVRPILAPGRDSEDPEHLARAVLAGVGEGLVYAGAIEPRIPGPAAGRGALFGTAAYVLAPLGGLARLLKPLSPHRRIPLVAGLLEDVEPEDREFLEALAMGVALAVLYGTADSSGTWDDE
jgi:hypothetical protein